MIRRILGLPQKHKVVLSDGNTIPLEINPRFGYCKETGGVRFFTFLGNFPKSYPEEGVYPPGPLDVAEGELNYVSGNPIPEAEWNSHYFHRLPSVGFYLALLTPPDQWNSNKSGPYQVKRVLGRIEEIK